MKKEEEEEEEEEKEEEGWVGGVGISGIGGGGGGGVGEGDCAADLNQKPWQRPGQQQPLGDHHALALSERPLCRGTAQVTWGGGEQQRMVAAESEAAAGQGGRIGRRRRRKKRRRKRKRRGGFDRPGVLIQSAHDMPAGAPSGAQPRLR